MLVKFRSPRAAEFVMFGEIADHLIKIMGCSGSVPGAIKAEDIPAALARLAAATATEVSIPAVDSPRNEDDEAPRVSLGHRALPLVQMLEAALADNSYVMWER